jgi:CelD/BcsL family acetyltransferase involved in cellulose biosynthesis
VHALGEPATQYCDALVLQDCDRASAVAAAWKLLTSGCGADLLYLRRIRDDAAISLLPAVGQMPAIDYAPFVDLNRAAGMAHRSGQRRKTLRKSLRRLSSLGEVVFECIDSPTEKIHAVDQAVALKRAWMRRRGLWSGGYAHPAADTFTRFLAPDPAFKVTVLRVGEHSAGIEAGYVHGDTYWALTKSYDEKFAAMGPGQLLTQWLIDYYAARGMTRLDFLSPEQKYKLEWSTDKVGVRDMIVPVTWRGALLARAMATGLSAVKQVMPYLARLAA